MECLPGKPSPPINITFATTCDHLTVAWNEPESDGGLPLTHYKIELRGVIKLLDEVFVGVQTKRFTFTSKEGVNPRTLYTVAVQAFNELNNGTKGERVVMSSYCEYFAKMSLFPNKSSNAINRMVIGSVARRAADS